MDSKVSIGSDMCSRRFTIASDSPNGLNDSQISSDKLSYSAEGTNNSLIIPSKANNRALMQERRCYSTRILDMSRDSADYTDKACGRSDNLSGCLSSSDRSSDSLLSIRKSSVSQGRIDRSSVYSDIPVESSEHPVILDKSSESSDSPDESTNSLGNSHRSSDSPGSSDRSSDSQVSSNVSSDCEDSSYESSDSSDYSDDSPGSYNESSDSSDIPDGKSDLPDSPDDASDCPDSRDSPDEPSDSPESFFRSSNSSLSPDRSFCSDINVWLNGNFGKPTQLSLISSSISVFNCSSFSPGVLNNSLVSSEGSNNNYDRLGVSSYVLMDSRLFLLRGGSSSKSNTHDCFQGSREKSESFVGLNYDYYSYILSGDNLKKFRTASNVEVCVKRMLEQSEIIDSQKNYITNNKIGSISLTNGNLQLHVGNGYMKGKPKLIMPTPEYDIYSNPTMEYMIHGATGYVNIKDKQVKRVKLSKTTSNGRVDDELKVIEDYADGKTKGISENVLFCAENSQFIDKVNGLGAIPENSGNNISGIELSVQSDIGDKSSFCENNLMTENQPKAYSESSYEKRMAGSRVEDIEECQTTTGINPITENLHFRNKDIQLGTASNSLDLVSLDVIKSVKVICDSVLDTFQSCFNNIINIAKLKISPDSSMVAITQTESDTGSEEDSFELIEDSSNNNEASNCPDIEISPSKRTIKITSLYTLFKHLTAAAGTDITAEQVTEDINRKVVLDLHNGFHELRTVDYSNLELVEKCIIGCLGTLQNVMLKSHDIFTRNSVLMRMEARSFEEMKVLNEDLKELAFEAEMHMNDIESAVTGLSDFTEDYIYYKDCLSNELSEFLMEDFPEIFK